MRSFRTLSLSALMLFALTQVACQSSTAIDDPDTQSNTIIDVATAAGDFTTLLAAVDAAGLTETLDGDGPFTVFAPTDAAFDALPPGTVEALLADIPTLTDILLYHVVGAEVPASAVAAGLVTTLQGSDFRVTTDMGVTIGNTLGVANVTVTDIMADNGIIHVIDAVILPPPSIPEIVVDTPDFSTLLAALGAANLVDTLAGDGPFTVFAPTDAAFAALPPGTVEALLGDIPTLTDILLYHVVGSRLPAATVVGSSSVMTLQGNSAAITANGGLVYIDGAAILTTDIPAANGVIHIIDAVILP